MKFIRNVICCLFHGKHHRCLDMTTFAYGFMQRIRCDKCGREYTYVHEED